MGPMTVANAWSATSRGIVPSSATPSHSAAHGVCFSGFGSDNTTGGRLGDGVGLGLGDPLAAATGLPAMIPVASVAAAIQPQGFTRRLCTLGSLSVHGAGPV